MSLAQSRKLVDEIRAYVRSTDRTNDPQAQALAQQYGRACREANERLTRCAAFLQASRRPEAIAVSEAEPDLLQWVSALNFPELDEWQESAAEYGWDRFQALKTDVAAALDHSYRVERELAPLLRQHRLLALKQASVGERLAVLRQVAAADPTSLFWQEDVAAFERLRFAELEQQGRDALRRPDISPCQQFAAEFEKETWQSAVPPTVRDVYIQAVLRYQEQYHLPELVGNMARAHAQLNGPRLKALADEWTRGVEQIRRLCPSWQVTATLHAIVTPALEYLEYHEQQGRTQAYYADAQQLYDALQRGDHRETIDLLVAKAESHGYALPPQVLSELNSYRFTSSSAKALNVGVLIALVCAGIAAIIGIYFVLYGNRH